MVALAMLYGFAYRFAPVDGDRPATVVVGMVTCVYLLFSVGFWVAACQAKDQTSAFIVLPFDFRESSRAWLVLWFLLLAVLCPFVVIAGAVGGYCGGSAWEGLVHIIPPLALCVAGAPLAPAAALAVTSDNPNSFWMPNAVWIAVAIPGLAVFLSSSQAPGYGLLGCAIFVVASLATWKYYDLLYYHGPLDLIR